MSGSPALPAPGKSLRTQQRPDIQALRALAVGSVLAYHLWPQGLTGGYIGVDVFFVISGYLITSLLMRELTASGRIRIGAFWARRAARLLPASLLVLAVTALGVVLVVPRSLWTQFLTEIGASALYVQNWQLTATGVDYLANSNTHSPVLHFWTLSIEEQFYVGLPLLLLLTVIATRRRHIRIASAAVVAVLVAGSFVYGVWLTSAAPAVAYLSTFARAWEFGAGALLAFVPAPRPGWRWARLTPILGVWLIVATTITADSATPFPGVAALAPVGGALLAIWGGKGSLIEWLGRVAPIAVMGRISYSLYLWHWPLIVEVSYLLGGPLQTGDKAAVAAVSLALAWFTTTLVEDPVRFSPRLLGGRRPRTVGLWSLGGMAVVVSLCLVANSLNVARTHATQSAASGLRLEDERCFGAQAMDPDLQPCENPALVGAPVVPALTAVADDDANRSECWASSEEQVFRLCTLGPKTGYIKHVIALGDSHNNAFLGVYARLAEELNWRIDVSGHAGCYWTDLPIAGASSAATAGCTVWRARAAAYIAATPDVDAILVTRCALGRDATPKEVDGMVSAWNRRPVKTVPVIAILDSPWVPKTTTSCLEKHPLDGVTACAVRRDEALFDDGQTAAVSRVPRAETIDIRHLYCNDVTCPPIIGNVVVYRDNNHLTATYANTLTPYIAKDLVRIVTG